MRGAAILLLRGGTTFPEGAGIFSEGDIMHLGGGVYNTEGGMTH